MGRGWRGKRDPLYDPYFDDPNANRAAYFGWGEHGNDKHAQRPGSRDALAPPPHDTPARPQAKTDQQDPQNVPAGEAAQYLDRPVEDQQATHAARSGAADMSEEPAKPRGTTDEPADGNERSAYSQAMLKRTNGLLFKQWLKANYPGWLNRQITQAELDEKWQEYIKWLRVKFPPIPSLASSQ